ncbi:tyrosine-type recombinase/integrase [Variovorax sp. YR752]|uniref:tyrosine-type recombinase/integrase n=1 Tax=Variovorax sp. YR752 TaxID=1884383 RepID=UPI0015CDF961|nr:tyrosine-type recombinase/integrase [Variovorax sp. YR752]
MSSVQQRGNKFQLRVKHRLLKKPFFHTFDSEVEANSYAQILDGWLARGIVPLELLEASEGRGPASPLLLEVMRNYENDPNTRVAPSERPTLALLASETSGLRMSDITFHWVNKLIERYKTREDKKKLAPGTIRKRVGALSKVVEWYHRSTAKEGQQPAVNVLSLLPRGYSQYSDGSVRDVERDVRMSAEDEIAVRATLAGVKRPDKERAWGNDPDFEMLFSLIIETGLRLREAYRLRVEQVDAGRGVLRVDGSKGHHGASKPRMVPLKREIRARMSEYCKGRSGLVFPFWDGTPEDLQKCTARLSRRFATLFEYAMVPQFTEHDLRHETCCRWVLLKGERGWLFNEIEICKIMGWKDTKMMLRYASLRGEVLADRLL